MGAQGIGVRGLSVADIYRDVIQPVAVLIGGGLAVFGVLNALLKRVEVDPLGGLYDLPYLLMLAHFVLVLRILSVLKFDVSFVGLYGVMLILANWRGAFEDLGL